MLICQPVSHRSSHDKIERWIAHLEDLRGRHRNDASAVYVIDRLLNKAYRWIDAPAGADAN